MALKGWKKVDEYVYRSVTPSFPYGKTYDFVWGASNNTVRISESMPKNSDPLDLVRNSYVLYRGKTWGKTRKWLMNWIRKHPRG